MDTSGGRGLSSMSSLPISRETARSGAAAGGLQLTNTRRIRRILIDDKRVLKKTLDFD